MSDNFSGMYWIRKDQEHCELSAALRAAEARERRAIRRAQQQDDQEPTDDWAARLAFNYVEDGDDA